LCDKSVFSKVFGEGMGNRLSQYLYVNNVVVAEQLLSEEGLAHKISAS
jgi:hypothetical protein